MRKSGSWLLWISGMVAGTKYRGEFEERIKRIDEEVQQPGNILLFIDESAYDYRSRWCGRSTGCIQYFKTVSFQRRDPDLIGATTIEEYRKHIEKDAALERRFQPVMVEEPTKSRQLRS